MGTYVTAIVKNQYMGKIKEINDLWNQINPGFEEMFHLNTREDIEEEIKCIQKTLN
jgi:hypothetical protein